MSPIGLKLYPNLAGDVRYTGQHHSIKELVTPNDPEVKAIARELVQTPDFIRAAHHFVNSVTHYEREPGDFWATPGETLTVLEALQRGPAPERLLETVGADCDCKAILLCSILRNYISADNVFCAVGTWEGGGHMWVAVEDDHGVVRRLESTAPPSAPIRGSYVLEAIFNDQYVLATDKGLKDFDLKIARQPLYASRR